MREIDAESWGGEIARLGSVVLQTYVFDVSGIELHAPGDVVSGTQARLLQELAIPSVHVTEPREKPDEAAAALGVARVAGADLRDSDFLAREVRGRTAFPAGTRAEGAALEAMRSLPGAMFPVASRAR
ncbi:MAG TPA: hypothetical protein VNO22_15230, partial [Planctomycetota bacterium]|nr:hypothetical protein [Planctomycetota bacterium]